LLKKKKNNNNKKIISVVCTSMNLLVVLFAVSQQCTAQFLATPYPTATPLNSEESLSLSLLILGLVVGSMLLSLGIQCYCYRSAADKETRLVQRLMAEHADPEVAKKNTSFEKNTGYTRTAY